jgi:hypothetical protein
MERVGNFVQRKGTGLTQSPRLQVITKTEIPTSSHGDFNVEGYHTFLPMGPSDKLKMAKYRMMVVCEVRAGSHHKNSTGFNAPGRAERMDLDRLGKPLPSGRSI